MMPALFKRITPSPVKNWLRPVARKFNGRNTGPVRGQPPGTLTIELTNKCNLNCPYCLVGLQNSLPFTEHDLMPRGLGFMDFKMYEKIVGDAADFGIKTIQLHFQGESLLHKRFPEMVCLAKRNGFKTLVFTNGLVLSREYGERIIKAGLDIMRFSVDGASEETYQKNRIGGKFERVYKNMAMMAELARVSNSTIHLEWQMIALKNNEHEIPRARQMAKEIGVHFFVKNLAVTDRELIPDNPKYHRQMHIKPCIDIYRNIFIYWNGDVVPCCYDLKGENVAGNIGKNTLEEIWNSHAFADLRRRIDNAYDEPDYEPGMCKSCLKWSHEPWKTSDGKTVWSRDKTPLRDVYIEGS